MTTRHALLLTAVTWILLAGCSRRAEDPRLVLIGVDGGSWHVLDPLLAAGELPRLAALAERGVTADFEVSVEPLISPTAWTSIATGRRAEVHGITTFTADRRAIRVPTAWERMAAAGLSVGLYDYLITWPPRELPGGFVVPGWLRRDMTTSPPDLFERTGVPGYRYEVIDIGTLDDVVDNVEDELTHKPRTWNRLAAQLNPQVGAVVFFAVDVISHRFYHTLQADAPDPLAATEARFDDVVARTLRGLDRAIGEILDELDPDDHVVVVSDHGFGPIEEVTRFWGFDRSWLLAKAGVDPRRDGVSVINSFIQLELELENGEVAEREAVLLEIDQLFSAIREPDGGPLFQVEIVREPERAEEAGYPPWKVETIGDRMPADAFVFIQPVTEVFDRLGPEGLVDVAGERHPIRAFATPHVFTGDHEPTGIFIAAGRAFHPRPERTRLSVLDVAPLLFYLAGQPIPDDLEGELPEALIAPRHLQRRPPQWVPAAEVPGLPEEPAEGAPAESDAEIERRLKALGYL